MYDLKFYSEYFFRAANSGYSLNSSSLPKRKDSGVSLLSGPRFSKPETFIYSKDSIYAAPTKH
jgi:hypothetical protein